MRTIHFPKLVLGLLVLLLPSTVVAGNAIALTPSTGSGSPASPAGKTAVTVNGPAVKIAVTKSGEVLKEKFKGEGGQIVSAVVTNIEMSDNGFNTVTLIDPNGDVVGSPSETSGNGNPNGVGPFQLAQNGTYTVKFKLDKRATGTGKLWVSAPVDLGTEVVNGSAEPMDVSRVGGGAERTFSGQAGQIVTAVETDITLSDQGFDTITLIDPSGDTVGSPSETSGNGNPNGTGPFTLSESGTYTVLYQVDTTATGNGELWVSVPVDLGAVQVNGPAVSMNVTRVGGGAERTFTGAAGQKITATVSGIAMSDDGFDTLTLYGPNGNVIGSPSEDSGNGNPNVLGPLKLNSNATYTLLFQVDNTATGTGNLKVTG